MKIAKDDPKICLFRLSALGDVVMMIPTIRTLQKNLPKAELTWVIAPAFYPIVKYLKGVNFVTLDKPKTLKSWLVERQRLRALGEFDYLLAMQASMSAHLLYPCIRAKVKIGYDSVRSKDLHPLFVDRQIPYQREHILEGFLGFPKKMGISEICWDGAIPISQAAKDKASSLLPKEPFFVVHPVASKPERTASKAFYRSIIARITSKYGLQAVITGSQQDVAFCRDIAKESGVLNLAGKVDLETLPAVLEKALFLIAPDTGPIHIASALGVCPIGLYVSMGSQFTGPYFHKESVVDCYEEALAFYGKPPKTKRGAPTRLHESSMMKLIQEEKVLERVDTFMG